MQDLAIKCSNKTEYDKVAAKVKKAYPDYDDSLDSVPLANPVIFVLHRNRDLINAELSDIESDEKVLTAAQYLNGRTPKVNFLLKYDLDEDPVEEFETMDEVKERIKTLTEGESSLKRDSILIYEIKSVKKVSVETKITIK